MIRGDAQGEISATLGREAVCEVPARAPRARASRAKTKAGRAFYFCLGLLFVGLGYLGFVLPVMPGTIFIILALNCFRRSHEPLENWLLYKTRFGPTLQAWDERGSIKLKTKKIIVLVLWLSIIGSCASAYRHVPDLGLRFGLCGLLVATAAGVTLYVVTRPTEVDATSQSQDGV